MKRPNPATQHHISRRLQSILDCIRESILSRGYPPSIREVGEAVGLSSSSTVHTHLSTLERKGFIRRTPGGPRSITLLDFADTTQALEVPCCHQIDSSLTLEEGIHEGHCVASVTGKMPGGEPDHAGVLLNPTDAMLAGQWLVAWARRRMQVRA